MRKIVLAQVGEKGAGKETVFSIFRHCLPPGITMGIHHLSDPLGETLQLLGPPLCRNNYQLLSQIINKPLNITPNSSTWIGTVREDLLQMMNLRPIGLILKKFCIPLTIHNTALFINYLTNPADPERLTWEDLTKTETENILANTVKRRALADPNSITGLDGVRWREDETMVRSFPSDVLSILIYTTADADIRYKRLKKRKEKTGEDELNREQFDREEKTHTEIFIPQIGSRADWRIDNNGTEAELTDKVDEFFRSQIKPILPLLRLKTTIS